VPRFGGNIFIVPYEFTENEREPETAAASSRYGKPPLKAAGIGVLDPPVPPRRPVGPLRWIPAPLLLKILAVLILSGIGISILLLLLHTL
jgi:hypothetical protein